MTVLFHGSVQEYTAGESSCDAEGAPDMRALIALLGERYGGQFTDFLLGDGLCFFLVNGKGIMMTGGLGTPLQPGDTVEVLPFVHGG